MHLNLVFCQKYVFKLLILSVIFWPITGYTKDKSKPPNGVSKTDCGKPRECQEFSIDGDPLALLPNKSLAPFRGYADPSLRYNVDTGELWMSYSWLSVGFQKSWSKKKPVIDFIVTNHLAKSTDRGQSFKFVKKLNSNFEATHANTGEKGWMTHEVSAIGRNARGNWEAMWIDYLDPFGPKKHGPAVLSHSTARSPERLGDNSRVLIRGKASPPINGAKYNLSEQAALKNCMTFMEPTIFSYNGDDYLAANCVIFKGFFKGSRRSDLEKLWLFKKTTEGYKYIGFLLDYEDAKTFGGERMEQAELALSRDGKILLFATPQTEGAVHYGCYALEVESLDPPRMKRKPDGSLVVRHYFTDGASKPNGPGACTYDPMSETGVIIVRRDFDLKKRPPRLSFSLMATGVHP